MAVDDLFAGGQADARSGVAIACVQTLKHHEDSVEVLRCDTYAVIAHMKLPLTVLTGSTYVDGGSFGIAELDGVADQVLEELRQLNLISLN